MVPFGTVGLDWAYWQITDGNDEIATDGRGGKARGGTFGWHAAAGLSLVLDFFDPDAARDFERLLAVTELVGHVGADRAGAIPRVELGHAVEKRRRAIETAGRDFHRPHIVTVQR